MASRSSVVTRKGQITIPADLRRELGIEQGDQMVFIREDGALRVIPALEIVRRTAGIFRLPEGQRPYTIAEEKEAFAQAVADEVMESMSRS